MRYIRYALWFLVILVGVVFTAMNARSVQINYFFGSGKAEIFLPLLIVIVLVIGLILGYLAAVPKIMRLRHTIDTLSTLNVPPERR